VPRSARSETDSRLATITQMDGPPPRRSRRRNKAQRSRGGRRSGGGWLWTLFAFVCAGAAGYYAWDYRENLTETRAQLQALRSKQQAPPKRPAPAKKKPNRVAVKTKKELAACEREVRELKERPVAPPAPNEELKSLTKRFRKMINSGNLDVSFRRGQMVVKLPAKVLFASGQAQLSDQGKEALVEVAKVLRDMRGRHFIVAGHTDSIPINDEEFANNWELSTARALSVTWMLIEQGVPPSSLAAAGHGQHKPIASNKTAWGRQRNRRIEIILEPDLRALPLKKLAKPTLLGKR